jgi:hypothetical protein
MVRQAVPVSDVGCDDRGTVSAGLVGSYRDVETLDGDVSEQVFVFG